MSARLLIHYNAKLGAPRTPLQESDEWGSPDAVFAEASRLWGPYLIDVAAARWNHLCEEYFTKRVNALKQKWRGRCWMNPPYSRGNLYKFMGYARGQAFAGHADLVTCLVPSYTSERWWHDHVLKRAGVVLRMEHVHHAGFASGFRMLGSGWGIEQLHLDGRLRYRHKNGVADSARHPSALITFYGPNLVTVDGFLRSGKSGQRQMAGSRYLPDVATAAPASPFQVGRGGRLFLGATNA